MLPHDLTSKSIWFVGARYNANTAQKSLDEGLPGHVGLWDLHDAVKKWEPAVWTLNKKVAGNTYAYATDNQETQAMPEPPTVTQLILRVVVKNHAGFWCDCFLQAIQKFGLRFVLGSPSSGAIGVEAPVERWKQRKERERQGKKHQSQTRQEGKSKTSSQQEKAAKARNWWVHASFNSRDKSSQQIGPH